MNLWLQPFALMYNYNDFHVMLYFEGHPDYEAVEAFIRVKKDGKSSIRIIVTSKTGEQIDYVNDMATIDNIKSESVQRKVVYSEIMYSKNTVNRVQHISLQFESIKKEKIIFEFFAAGKASEKHAGLADPEGHSEKTSLPVMYRKRSTLASKKSRLSIDGIDYKIPVLIKVPLFFTGLKGYYSEEFSLGVLRTTDNCFQCISEPESMTQGQSWVYKSGAKQEVYTISKCDSDALIVENSKQKIYLIKKQEDLYLKKVEAIDSHASCNKIVLEFSSPLLLNSAIGSNVPADFSISIDSQQNVITGEALVKSDGKTTDYFLLPKVPLWATKRPYFASVTYEENSILVKTGIYNDVK